MWLNYNMSSDNIVPITVSNGPGLLTHKNYVFFLSSKEMSSDVIILDTKEISNTFRY